MNNTIIRSLNIYLNNTGEPHHRAATKLLKGRRFIRRWNFFFLVKFDTSSYRYCRHKRRLSPVKHILFSKGINERIDSVCKFVYVCVMKFVYVYVCVMKASFSSKKGFFSWLTHANFNIYLYLFNFFTKSRPPLYS